MASGVQVEGEERILASGEFVEGLLFRVERREKETLRLRRKVVGIPALMKKGVVGEGLKES